LDEPFFPPRLYNSNHCLNLRTGAFSVCYLFCRQAFLSQPASDLLWGKSNSIKAFPYNFMSLNINPDADGKEEQSGGNSLALV
jgi:hypothetical protein